MCQCGTDAPAQGTKNIAQDRMYREGRYYFLHTGISDIIYPELETLILPMLPYQGCRETHGLFIGCIGTHTKGRQVTSMFIQSEVTCDIASQRIHGLLEAYFDIKSQWWATKRIYHLYEDGIEKSVPHDHHFSSLGKPYGAKR